PRASETAILNRMGRIRRTIVLRCALLMLLLVPAAVSAQPQQPIGSFVADVRGIFARHKVEPSVANDLDVVPANVPTRSFGLSGGIGRSKLYIERQDAPVSDAPGRKTINYGAGARWFTNHHVAFSAEVRWYSVSPQAATPGGGVAQPRTTLMVLSGGIGLR